jgi:cytochrome c oxidase cbb3-type subunit I/II
VSAEAIETVRYDDAIVRKFVIATVVWGIIGMLVGVVIALQLAWFPANQTEFFTFGRLRPLHTNAVIFAFAGNAIFAAVYYSTQRLMKARMFSDLMSKVHFWGWQAIIASAAVTLPAGFTQAREYAELEWPIDIAITVIWVVFAVNFFMTLKNRREKHIYVAIWFYIATIVTVAVLHIFNNLHIPVSFLKSYSMYAGVHDALVQWWYGHNAVAFFLTTPFLGLMYYFLPKAADRPVFSYKLSILHFWSLVFIYIWAGPHHLHYTALPEWASTLGMVFSIMLWMPSWGGMINGLFTLRGAWHKLRDDSVLKFFVVGITFYGMSTFEGPMLSIKAVNSLTHYTDWTIAHVHSGALGWNGFMTFGMIYWLLPRLWKTKLYSEKLANIHFWIGTIGIVVYIISMYWAGLTQGLMWRAFDETGVLRYDFMQTVERLIPLYWVRMVGGTLYLAGVILMAYNMVRTMMTAPKDLSDPEVNVPAPAWRATGSSASLTNFKGAKTWDDIFYGFDDIVKHGWHRALEGWPMVFTALTTAAILIGGIVEIIPMMLVKSNIPTIETVEPYTPLEIEGRDIYVREGCYNCHSQMIRPMRHEVERYGEYSKPGEFVYDRPFQWGSKRTGPDLARVGGKYPNLWHVRHMENPRSTTPRSVMPPYPWLLEKELDLSDTQDKVEAMAMLGAYYEMPVLESAESFAREQAHQIAADVYPEVDGETPEERADREAKIAELEKKEIVALVAYLQRLGTDISKTPELDDTTVARADKGGEQ